MKKMIAAAMATLMLLMAGCSGGGGGVVVNVSAQKLSEDEVDYRHSRVNREVGDAN